MFSTDLLSQKFIDAEMLRESAIDDSFLSLLTFTPFAFHRCRMKSDYRRLPCVMIIAKENSLLPTPTKIDDRRPRFSRVIFFHLQFFWVPNFGLVG
jgi:hypothetical protein